MERNDLKTDLAPHFLRRSYAYVWHDNMATTNWSNVALKVASNFLSDAGYTRWRWDEMDDVEMDDVWQI